MKVFPLKCFAVYSSYSYRRANDVTMSTSATVSLINIDVNHNILETNLCASALASYIATFQDGAY